MGKKRNDLNVQLFNLQARLRLKRKLECKQCIFIIIIIIIERWIAKAFGEIRWMRCCLRCLQCSQIFELPHNLFLCSYFHDFHPFFFSASSDLLAAPFPHTHTHTKRNTPKGKDLTSKVGCQNNWERRKNKAFLAAELPFLPVIPEFFFYFLLLEH